MGYDRPVLNFPVGMDEGGLVEALEFAEETRRAIKKNPEAAMTHLVSDPGSLAMVLNAFVEHGLFEEFSIRLIKNKDIRVMLCGEQGTRTDIEVSGLVDMPEYYHSVILDLAGKFLRDEGPKHFEHRTRFMAEVLGTYLAMARAEVHQNEEGNGREEEKVVS